MNTKSNETIQTDTQSRRSFGKSIAAAVMTLPFAGSIVIGQKRKPTPSQDKGKPKLGPRADIPPIIIKASKDGMFEIWTNRELSEPTPNDGAGRPWKQVYSVGDEDFDVKRMDFDGSVNAKKEIYRNLASQGCQIRFWLNGKSTSQPANILISKCDSDCKGIKIEIDKDKLLGPDSTGSDDWDWKYTYPGGNPGNKVTTIRVYDVDDAVALYETSEPVFVAEPIKLAFESVP